MNRKIVFAICLVGVGLATSSVVRVKAQVPSAPAPPVQTFDLWVSQGFAGPPYFPFHDCATFTKTQMCLAVCGDCGSLSKMEFGSATLWKGEVPCGGLNLVFTGTARNGP